jgi:NADH-quinone oxidoreductase subunit A
VEIIFFYPWAVNFREADWEGYFEMMIFLGFLLFGFYYILKKGALEWKEK